jgi:hypothetical protein
MIGPALSEWEVASVNNRRGEADTVSLVPFFDLESELASHEDVPEDLVPACNSTEFGAGYVGKRMEEETVSKQSKTVSSS